MSSQIIENKESVIDLQQKIDTQDQNFMKEI
jgi:hypothetical protein